MNQRFPLAYSTLGCPKWSFEQAAAQAAANGYRGLEVRALDGKMDTVLRRRSALDQYTHAHLSEAKLRIGKALDASYIYNQASGGGGASPFMIFGAAPGN